jgi:hypothetical protein
VRKNPRTYKRRHDLKEICRRSGISMKQYAVLRRNLKEIGKEVKLQIED